VGPSDGGYTYRSGQGDALLLTGATGFVGMEVLARFLERTDRDLYVLVRGADDVEVTRRVEGALSTLYGREHSYIRRVGAVRGDITREGLGLPDRRREELAERVGEIIHVAASVEFDLGLDRLDQQGGAALRPSSTIGSPADAMLRARCEAAIGRRYG